MRKILAALLAASVVCLSVAMTACNKDSKEESKREPVSTDTSEQQRSEVSEEKPPEVSVDRSTPKITESQIAEINKKITSYQAVPEFDCKSESINARDFSDGITVSFIPENSEDAYMSMLARNFRNAAYSAGFKKIIVSETSASASSVTDALGEAVKEKSDLAVLAGDINKDNITGSIERTQANGIEVYSAGSKSAGEQDHYVDYTVPINYHVIGELMADWGIVKTNGSINALAVNIKDSTLSGTIFKGFKSEFEKYISSSSGYCTTLNASSIEIGNGLANKIKKAVTEDSNLTYIFVFDGAAIQDAITAADQLGGNIKIISTGGSTKAFDAAQNGKIDMLVAQSYEWTAYATVDYILRVLGNKNLPAEQFVPVRVINKDSIAKDIKEYSGPDYDEFHEICFGAAFVNGYTNLWRL